MNFFKESTGDINIEISCRGFRNALNKLGLHRASTLYRSYDNIYLSALEILSLHENNLFGTIPPQISTLDTLVELSLADNRLIGDLPHEIGFMRQLQVLDIRKC